MFFWKVYSNTVFYENYMVLQKNFECTPITVSPIGAVDKMLVSYYNYLLAGGEDIYTYLAMRDYPVVYTVNSDVASPPFDPMLYAKFEDGVKTKGEKGNNGFGPNIALRP